MTATKISASIELFLLSNDFLAINKAFGLAALNKYYSELSLIEAGVPFKDLGFSEQREAGLPKVLSNSTLVTARDLMSSQIKKDSIAVLKLSGVMRSQDGLSHYGIDTFNEWLRAAYSNPNIKGVIMEIESGGGEWMAGNKLSSTLSERNKPVLSFVHFAGSAAYLAASKTDEIMMSSEGSEVGSIGVFVPLNKEALNYYRENYEFVYAEQSPDKNAADRGLMAGDYTKIQDEVNALAVVFQNMVQSNRQLKGGVDTIKKTLSGGMFMATDAKKRGLADSTGNMVQALKRLNQLIK